MTTSPTLLGLYRPGTGLLHRLGVGPKLAALAVLSIAVAVLRGPWVSLTGLGIALALTVWAATGLRVTVRALRPVLFVAALLAAYQTWRAGWPVAVEVAADLLTLVLAATVLTATTPTEQMLDAVARALRPLRRFGVEPDRVALALALMLRTVPGLLQIAGDVRDAARARGLGRNPRAMLVPMVLRTVARATTTGEALAARGIGEGRDE